MRIHQIKQRARSLDLPPRRKAESGLYYGQHMLYIGPCPITGGFESEADAVAAAEMIRDACEIRGGSIEIRWGHRGPTLRHVNCTRY